MTDEGRCWCVEHTVVAVCGVLICAMLTLQELFSLVLVSGEDLGFHASLGIECDLSTGFYFSIFFHFAN
jgi:hypothetical protein